MSVQSTLQSALDKVIAQAGVQVRLRHYYKTVGSVWDDDVSLTVGSEFWTSGVTFPVRGRTGTSDAFLIEQGKLTTNDIKLYISGGANTAGSINVIKVGLGSPPTYEYSAITDGTIKYSAYNTDIYKLLYLRRLPTGSLIGE